MRLEISVEAGALVIAGHIQLHAEPAGSPGITLGKACSPQRMGLVPGCRTLGEYHLIMCPITMPSKSAVS